MQRRMNVKRLLEKNLEGRAYGLFLAFLWKFFGKIAKGSVRRAGVSAEIQIERLHQ
jgi:hypothetical protein